MHIDSLDVNYCFTGENSIRITSGLKAHVHCFEKSMEILKSNLKD